MYYNNEYDLCVEVIIKSNSHDSCLFIAKQVKHLCEAWSFNVRFDEYKSARKGDVLMRDLLIYQTGYASDIITFCESLRHVCFHYNNYMQKTSSVSVNIREVSHKDSRKNLENHVGLNCQGLIEKI